MGEHTCHARNCTTPCARKMLMCRAHWNRVPAGIQRLVYGAYRKGQESGEGPITKEWNAAADAAIVYVFTLEKWEARER